MGRELAARGSAVYRGQRRIEMRKNAGCWLERAPWQLAIKFSSFNKGRAWGVCVCVAAVAVAANKCRDKKSELPPRLRARPCELEYFRPCERGRERKSGINMGGELATAGNCAS